VKAGTTCNREGFGVAGERTVRCGISMMSANGGCRMEILQRVLEFGAHAAAAATSDWWQGML